MIPSPKRSTVRLGIRVHMKGSLEACRERTREIGKMEGVCPRYQSSRTFDLSPLSAAKMNGRRKS